jgi:hypothetical protein
MAFIFKSLLTSWLQLKRDRPSSHAGKLYRIDEGVGEGPSRGAPPPQGLEVQAGGVQFSVLAPVPPCYDPELAGLLRTVCMVFGSGRGLPVGARAFPVLVGSTLANWYHLGSQVPWKQQIHLAVAVAGCPWPARQVASRATADLRRALGTGKGDTALQRAVFTEEDGVLEWTVRGLRKDRPVVLVVIRLQVTPERAADLPALSQLRRVAIDGGNTGVFIPGAPRELTAALREVGKDAAARLEMPREWYWCAEESAFVRPGLMARALQWPPNVATAKVVAAAVVFMLVVYGLTMMALPEWGSHLRKRASARGGNSPMLSYVASPSASPSASASPATRTT